MSAMTIGQVARRAGLGVETIRFYERRGLIDEPARKASGYRQYTIDAVRQLRFIRRAKRLGFSLREIAELLDLRSSSADQCGGVRQQLEAKVADVERRISELRQLRTALGELAATCAEQDPRSSCPILVALQKTAWEEIEA